LPMQVKLLRLLQERTYEPVGSSTSTTANFRLVVATNRDLAEQVRLGRFRRDLYYRLHVCPVHLPPLRERPCDVAPLFQHFWKRHGESRPVTSAVMRQLERYDWPGNVRELENLVERLSVCAQGRIIEMADLPPSFIGVHGSSLRDCVEPTSPGAGEDAQDLWPDRGVTSETISLSERSGLLDASVRRGPVNLAPDGGAAASVLETVALASPLPANLTLPVDLPNLLQTLEDFYIRAALEQSGGNKKEAARLLGLGRTTLVEKLRRRAADVSAP